MDTNCAEMRKEPQALVVKGFRILILLNLHKIVANFNFYGKLRKNNPRRSGKMEGN